MVGVGRLELPASWSRTKRATSCATPRCSPFIIITVRPLVKENLGAYACPRVGVTMKCDRDRKKG